MIIDSGFVLYFVSDEICITCDLYTAIFKNRFNIDAPKPQNAVFIVSYMNKPLLYSNMVDNCG